MSRGRSNRSGKNQGQRPNQRPATMRTRIGSGNETEVTLSLLKELLHSRNESEQYFAKQKLKAYENALILKSGVRVKRKGEAKTQPPEKGDTITVRYTGARPDGKFFDSGNITFIVGKGEVIQAWDEAFLHINEGQDATIFCPSATAYGKRGAGKLIPPHTTLIFDVTLLKISRLRKQ